MKKPKLLFIDIETFPIEAYVWGLYDVTIAPNQIKSSGGIACWAAKWFGKKEIMFADRRKPWGMLDNLWSLLHSCDMVCHFNGQSFDIPTINTAFAKNGYSPPAPYKQIDLYRAAKAAFRFPSNKLEFIVKELRIGEKIKNEGMPLWTKCMAGDKKAWKNMEAYCKHDTRLLEPLYLKMRPWIKNHPNTNVYFDEDGNKHCGICRSKRLLSNGERATNTKTYTRYSCKDCGSWNYEIHEQIRVGG